MRGAARLICSEPRILRSSAGRLRLHLEEWPEGGCRALERAIRHSRGVLAVQASALTGNVLVRYDEGSLQQHELLRAVRAALRESHQMEPTAAAAAQKPTATARRNPVEAGQSGRVQAKPSEKGLRRTAAALIRRAGVVEERAGALRRARVGVPGLDRDDAFAQRVVDALRARRGVAAVSASRITGRVLVEFNEHQTDVEDLLSAIAGIELPDLPGEDLAQHPLDPLPLIQSAARTLGASLGLGLLGVRRLAGSSAPPSAGSVPAAAAAAVGILEGLPPLRRGSRRMLGRDRAQLAIAAVQVVSLTFTGSALGLALTGAGGLRLYLAVRARRSAWRTYEESLGEGGEALPGETIRLRAGERCPLAGTVIEGFGTMIGRDGLPHPLHPDLEVSAGARLHGGPFAIELHGAESFQPPVRPVPPPQTPLDRYLSLLSPASIGFAAITAVLTRSPQRTAAALLLVNARPALIGAESADAAASARLARCGVTVVAERSGQRTFAVPDVLLIDGARVLTGGRLQVGGVLSLSAGLEESEVLSIASGIAAESGSPWGPSFPPAGRAAVGEAKFDGAVASGTVAGRLITLGGGDLAELPPAAAELRRQGSEVLLVERAGEQGPLGIVALRPRLAPSARALLELCRRRGIAVKLLAEQEAAVPQMLGERLSVEVLHCSSLQAIERHQRAGKLVALLSDSAGAAEALAASDIAIALCGSSKDGFPARAELLARDLDGVAEILRTSSRRRAAVNDAIALSALSNVVGAVVGVRAGLGWRLGSEPTHLAALAAVGAVSIRLAGGRPSAASTRRLADPQPERWGSPPLDQVLARLQSSTEGLSQQEVQRRRVQIQAKRPKSPVMIALADQVRSPLNGALAAGAAISLAFGAIADVALIAAVLAGNTAIAVWQEHEAILAGELLARESRTRVRVRRAGQTIEVSAEEIVVGDVITLGSGDRVPADARLIESDSFEVDEAALTGESLPVSKDAHHRSDASRVILEGSDVTVGSAAAVVFAVGQQTRLGATRAALEAIQPERGVLERRLMRTTRRSLPVIAGGAALILLFSVLRGRPLRPQLALAGSIATAVVPEGLPLLAGVGEAAVARRLAGRNALVRRIAAVEALGRVDVACADKTGTLTAGRLELTAIDTFGSLPEREALLAAALASPHPDAQDAGSHPTDRAVIEAAERRGLREEIRVRRLEEARFEPARAFHASRVDGRVLVKGAAEALVQRCGSVSVRGELQPLDAGGQRALLQAAEEMASRGLRVLIVCEGGEGASTEDPIDLTAIGLIGISDPLRPGVPRAIERCRQAGVRVVMLTGDHPLTAIAIAQEAGLAPGEGNVLTGAEISSLDDAELDCRLRDASVIARITPLDKLRIVERLQAAGHTVAMTGDGVNDAPALRLADVGVAMGLHGTEVAREASDVVLADDDFSTLVETLVEGRNFWRNLRRALALLLGGNLGELGLIVGASAVGLGAPLSTRQVLAVNLITDVLPAVAVAAQQPEHRSLHALRREGGGEGDRLLRREVLRRGVATAAPTLIAYAAAASRQPPERARSVAFGGIVATQLSQTVMLGRAEGRLTRPVLVAILGSGGFALAAVTVAPLRSFLGLLAPSPFGVLLTVLASATSVRLARSE